MPTSISVIRPARWGDEADPAALTLFYIIFKSNNGIGCPAIGRIIELNKHAEPGQEGLVDGIGALYVLNNKIAVGGQLIEPGLRPVCECKVMPAVLE